eukprot:760878_1
MMMHDLPYSDMFEMSFSDISPPPFETTLPEECSPKFSDQIPDTIAVDMGVFGGECGAREFVTWPTAHPPVDDCDDPVLSAPPSPRLDSGSGSDADVESGFESTASDDQPAMRSDSSADEPPSSATVDCDDHLSPPVACYRCSGSMDSVTDGITCSRCHRIQQSANSERLSSSQRAHLLNAPNDSRLGSALIVAVNEESVLHSWNNRPFDPTIAPSATGMCINMYYYCG